MIVVDSGYFYAAVVLNGKVVERTAPILKYMMGWTTKKVFDYCIKKKWKFALVS
jgi:hypothetical protein